MILKKIFVKPNYPENLTKLLKLADNLWWTWNYGAVNLFYRIDAPLFRELGHNPIKLLYLIPKEKIQKLSQDKGFLFELDKVWQQFEKYLKQSETLKKENAKKYGFGNNKESIAYFLMEFGVHESLPIYAGGLGILSGDFVKSASDMGIPVVGVGILYKYGYFTQRLNPDGKQEEIFIEFENHFEPLQEAQNQQKEPLYIETNILGEKTRIKVWQVNIGTARLILLDTDISENPSHLRDITYELYVADKEKRIQQELVLGKGGIDALTALGITPKIYHLNEGHSAFLILRRLQQLMQEEKLSFTEARAVIRSSTVFTTHTPLIEGNENFKTDLARKYLEGEVRSLGISFEEFAQLSFVENKTDTFWLPALAIRFSNFNNAVSIQHKDVSQEMWKNLFPTRPKAEIPIDYITNGVHSSWISESFSDILKRYLGEDISDIKDETILKRILDIPDEEIWEAHRKNKKILVPFVRKIISDAFVAKGYSQEKSQKLSSLLNPAYLTIGFARRFAVYKRPTLILKDKKRLTKILTNPDRPVQLIFAGKAHPADERGQDMIKEIMDFAKEYEVEDRVIFLENYDIDIARHLVWGADIWLNNPQEEMEASGTSGIKAAMNGVLNLSSLEGWWKEGFNNKNGWAITVGKFYNDSDQKEAAEANQIYNLLEEEITQHYYERNKKELPEKWIKMMKESIKSVLWKFNMNRALHEYIDKFYVNSLKESEKIRSHNYKVLKESVAEEKVVLQHWDAVHFINFSVNIDKDEQITEGKEVQAKCQIWLGETPPQFLKVEVFYLYDEGKTFKIIPMKLEQTTGNGSSYNCSFKLLGYGPQDINARVRPANEIVENLHPELIKWAN